MSAVLLDVLGPPAAGYGNWDIPLDYVGFKHIGIKACLRSNDPEGISIIFLNSLLDPITQVEYGQMSRTNPSFNLPNGISLDYPPPTFCYVAGSSDLFPTYLDITIYDFSTSDTFSSATCTALTPSVDSTEEIVSGQAQLLTTDPVSYIRLPHASEFGEGEVLGYDALSEVKVFGYRG